MARTPIHPGEILADELEETGLSAEKLADLIDVPPNRIYQLIAGKRSMTADTALRLGQYFGMSADFWMNLQSAYKLDLRASVGASRTHTVSQNPPKSAPPQKSRSQRFALTPKITSHPQHDKPNLLSPKTSNPSPPSSFFEPSMPSLSQKG